MKEEDMIIAVDFGSTIKGDSGAKLVSRVLQGQDANGGNVYLDTFDDGTTATFTAPKGEKGEKGDTPNLTNHQTKTDDTLNTESKEVVGAINEVNASKLDVSTINENFFRTLYN